jgi:hypothetical protein
MDSNGPRDRTGASSRIGDIGDLGDLGDLGDGCDLEGIGGGRTDDDQDSWVDAVVTLLAIVLFGLGWVLVELEGAGPPVNDYDASVSALWIASVGSPGDERIGNYATYPETGWTDRARKNSKR